MASCTVVVISASKKLLPTSGQKMEVVTHLPDSMVYIRGLQTFLWQWTTPIIMGSFAGHAWINDNNWYI
jgi:hypothetical protein